MALSIQGMLAWSGGRTKAELKQTEPDEHSSATVVGLVLIAASVSSFIGWQLWLEQHARLWSVALALAAAVLAAAVFRQLAHAAEATAPLVQRVGIELIAALMLVPGAWLAAMHGPPALFRAQIDTHADRVAVLAREAQAASGQRLAQIEALRNAHATSQRQVDDLEPTRLHWSRAMDRTQGAADRCENELRALRQSMPQLPYDLPLLVIHQNLEVRAAECEQAARYAKQVVQRYEQGFARKVAAAGVATVEARLRLEHAERNHASASRAVRDAEHKAQRPCLPLLDCHLQRAISSQAVGAFEAWGTALGLLFLGLLPALLLILLPLDAPALYRRHIGAIEAASLRSSEDVSLRNPPFQPK